MSTKFESIHTEFKPKARLLLQLGDQLIRNEKIALSELIKNAYDAGAKNVSVEMNDISDDVTFSSASIIIKDDGVGMDLDIIKNFWMEPGTNYKEDKYNNNFKGHLGRIPIGEKGIGRFGVHKLGNIIKIISKKKNSKEVEFEINWNDFQTDDYLSSKKIQISERADTLFKDGATGTYIEIRDLHNPWTLKEYRQLHRSALTISSPFETLDQFRITIKTNIKNWNEKLLTLKDVEEYALWYFECTIQEKVNLTQDTETIITDFLYKFNPTKQMDVKARIMTHNDDFIKKDPYIRLEKDKDLLKKEEQEYREQVEEFKHDLKNNKVDQKDKPQKPSKFFDPSLKNIGKIVIKGHIFDLDPETLELSDISDVAGFKKYTKSNGGVRVYRDNMRVYDYGEEGNDWLKMDAKRINAPTVKFANRNIISSVFLDGKSSHGLVEKTNREGFIENEDYEHFKGVVTNILNRVNKLRTLDKDSLKRTYFEEQDTTINANILIEQTKNKIIKYVKDPKEQKEVITLIGKVEDNYNSVKDIVLKSSGAGLAYSLVMHEIEKMISSLDQSVKNKDYDELREISLALSSAIDNITSLLSNDIVKKVSIFQIIDKALYFFKRRFKKHEIETIEDFDRNQKYIINCLNNLSVNAIMNILDNAIYWLGYWEKDLDDSAKVYMKILEKADYIYFIIADNGKGFYISEDLAKLPFKSTKDASLGKGLGLYFVNEIMKQNHGLLKIITSKNYKEELGLPIQYLQGATLMLQFRKEVV